MLSRRELFINLSGLLRPIAARYAPQMSEQLRPLYQPSMTGWNRRLGIALGMVVGRTRDPRGGTCRLTLRPEVFQRTRRGFT
jgi:hypothetical protein